MITKRTMKSERGAALILTVIVILVLTTLGIAMVTFTTTEERTASTFRDAAQTRMVAEAGVRLVQQMFDTPADRDLVPLYSSTGTADNAAWDYWGAAEDTTETQLNEIGVWRSVRPGASPGRYVGASNGFFKPPFGSGWADVFGGTYAPTNDVYDLKFNCRNPSNNNLITDWATTCWLHKLQTGTNALIDNSSSDWNLQTGRITDISFYGPPQVNGAAYGIATVRVTAEKRESWPDGTLLARETMIAIIGDATPKPAVFGNGNVDIAGQNSDSICGDGCMNVHAEGNLSGCNNPSGGDSPICSATGDAPGTDGDSAASLTAPEINPWDLTYKPTASAELQKYYLLAARQLALAWRDGDINTKGSSPRACGNDGLALCQDYNLEYLADGTTPNPVQRTATSTAYLYKWNTTNSEWDECDNAVDGDNTLGPGTCANAPVFAVTRAPDTPIVGSTDTADVPFNVNRVPETEFKISTFRDGMILLVDGKFYKHGNDNGKATVIAAGTIGLHSNSEWLPAMSNQALWIAGRDISIQSNCCINTNNSCGLSDANVIQWSHIMAAHEQMYSNSNTATAGIIMGENKVDYDDDVTRTDAGGAIGLHKSTHKYVCGYPDWPWALPTTPVILSLSTASD